MKVIFSLLLSGLIFTGVVFAVGQSSETVTSAKFCLNLDDLETKAEDKLALHMAKALEKQIDRDKKIKVKRETEAKNLAKKQLEWQARQDENYQKLLATTKNESQKESLATFQIAVGQATKTKKIAIETAIADFHNAVDALILKRNDGGNDAVESYKALINHAFDEARSSCASEEDTILVRKNLHTDLQKAKTEYRAALKEMENHGQEVKDLAKIKNTAIRQAVTDFKATVLKEKEKLTGI